MLLGSHTDGKPVTTLPEALCSPDLTNLFVGNLGMYILGKTPYAAGQMLEIQKEAFLFHSFSSFYLSENHPYMW